MRGLLITVFTAAVLAAQDPREIVLQSAMRDARDQELRRNYTFVQREELRRFDGSGNETSVERKVYDILMLYGRPYRRLTGKGGESLSAAEEKREQTRLDKEMAKRARETDGDRTKRLLEQQKELEEEREFRKEIADAFTFRLAGEEVLGGLPAYVVEAEPKPGYKPRTRHGKVLTKVHGKLWISKSDRRWVKVDTEFLDTFSLGWFLVRVNKGTQMMFESTRVGGEVWLPRAAHLRGEARLAGVKKYRLDLRVNWDNYRKFQTDSRIVEMPVVQQ